MVGTERIIDGDEEKLYLGIVLASIQVIVFFTFIYLCSFRAEYLNQDAFEIGIPLSFLCGLLVIACGVVLTAVYVITANHKGR
jgi:uncharacterized membrane protein (DUF485 family)